MSEAQQTPQPQPESLPDMAAMTEAERAGMVLGVLRKAGEGIPAREALTHQAFAAGSTIFDAVKGNGWDAMSLVAFFTSQMVNTIRTLEWIERSKATQPAPEAGQS